jgi:hypothetical protein
MRRSSENGQAIVLVVAAIGLVLMGALGLAVDASQLYGHRQMAQGAADAAAESAILSIYGATNTGTNAFGTATFTCTSGTDVRTPCAYAQLNSFGQAGSSDTISVDFPTSVTGVTLSTDFTPAAVHVLISRPVNNTLTRLLGAAATTTIKAAATAAIMKVTNPVPIVVLKPTGSGTFSLGGNTLVKICGGPQKSIQVDSTDAGAVSVSGTASVDLSHGGPLDTSGTCVGTGTDFAVTGGPNPPTPTTLPSWMTPSGTTTHYYSHDPRMLDPLSGVAAPSSSGLTVNPPTTPLSAGAGGCPLTASHGCTVYSPGNYTTGIGVQNSLAVFNPGIYYISGHGSGPFSTVGFGTQGTNSDMTMCQYTSVPCTADTSGCCGGGGMLVYLTAAADIFSVTANSTSHLLGSDVGSSYKGILFFVDHSASAQTHSLGGGSALTVQGTVYAHSTNYNQTINGQGGSGSGTLVQGEIITDLLSLGGGGSIQMNLNAGQSYSINQVALVN